MSIRRRVARAVAAVSLVMACAACTGNPIIITQADLDLPKCNYEAPLHVEDLVDQVHDHCNPEGATLVYPDGYSTTVGSMAGNRVVYADGNKAYGSDNIGRHGVIAFAATDHGRRIQWWGPKKALQLYWKANGKKLDYYSSAPAPSHRDGKSTEAVHPDRDHVARDEIVDI